MTTCPQMLQSGGWRALLLVPPRMFQSGASGLPPPFFVVVSLGTLLLVFVCSWLLVHGLVLVTPSLRLLGLLLVAAPLLLLGLVPAVAPPHPPILVHLCASLRHLGLVLILFSLLLPDLVLHSASLLLLGLVLVAASVAPRGACCLFRAGCSSPEGRPRRLVPGCSFPGGGGSCCLTQPGRSSPGRPVSLALLGLVFPSVTPLGRGCVVVVRAVRVWSTRRPLLPGTCPCAVVVAGGMPLWQPRGPAWCARPRPVRFLSVLWLAFPTPWCLYPSWGLSPPDLLGGCAGHAEAGREPGSFCLLLAPTEAGAPGSLRVVPVQGPVMGLSLACPSGIGLGLRALRWLACVDPVTDAGHVFGHWQHRPMPGKLAALNHWERPTTISKLRSFMRFCNYFSG